MAKYGCGRVLLLNLLVLIILVWGQLDIYSKFHQSDYHVVAERADLVRINKQYMHEYSVHTFKFNRSTTAFNASFKSKIYLGHDLELVAQVYKFASNEYRLFPLRLQVNFCKAVTSDIGGAHTAFMKCGNFSHCPLLKDRLYHVCYFTLDESKLPPYMPTGRFMVEVQGMYFTTELLVVRGYAEVTRPVTWH